MTQHAVDLLRKYAEIVNEAQQPTQLDEGVMDMIKSAFMKVAQKVLSPEDLQQIASIANQATGGNPVPNKENAMKVVQALGITQQDAQQAIQSNGGQSVAGTQPNGGQSVAGTQPVSEEMGPKLKQRILTAVAGAAAVGGSIVAGMTTPGLGLLVIGYCLLQFAASMPDEKSDAKTLADQQARDAWKRKNSPWLYKDQPPKA